MKKQRILLMSIKSLIAGVIGLAAAYGAVSFFVDSVFRESMIPATPPSERYRVWHPRGFSVIRPPGWFTRVWRNGTPTIILESIEAGTGMAVRKAKGTIFVIEHGVKPVVDRADATQFQSRPALYVSQRKEGVFLDSDASFLYRIFIERRGRWFEIGYSVDQEVTELPEMARRYLETFQVENESER